MLSSMAESTSGSTGAPFRFSFPAIPHMNLVTHLRGGDAHRPVHYRNPLPQRPAKVRPLGERKKGPDDRDAGHGSQSHDYPVHPGIQWAPGLAAKLHDRDLLADDDELFDSGLAAAAAAKVNDRRLATV